MLKETLKGNVSEGAGYLRTMFHCEKLTKTRLYSAGKFSSAFVEKTLFMHKRAISHPVFVNANMQICSAEPRKGVLFPFLGFFVILGSYSSNVK